MDSLAFIERGERAKISPLMVLHGDEPFLKRQVLNALRERVLGEEGDDMAYSAHAGDKANFSAVFDELQTLPFFSKRRLIVVDAADPFVTKFRALLEKKVKQMPETGVLVLDVKAWPSNTKLAKMVPDEATLVCKSRPTHHLPPWCVKWAETQHSKKLANPAATLLVDLVGAEMGLLDQELQKLAIYVGERGVIELTDVDQLVGHSRSEDTFKIFDAIGAGQAKVALAMLDRLCDRGEEPLKILGAFSYQLRKLAKAARWAQQGTSVGAALERAGIPPFALRNAEQQLRHIGRRRANRLYDWLLEVDFGMKGGSPLPPRTLLERLVIRLAQKST